MRNKVKIVVMLRGREMQHSNLAFDLANRFLTDLEGEPIVVEKRHNWKAERNTVFSPSINTAVALYFYKRLTECFFVDKIDR